MRPKRVGSGCFLPVAPASARGLPSWPRSWFRTSPGPLLPFPRGRQPSQEGKALFGWMKSSGPHSLRSSASANRESVGWTGQEPRSRFRNQGMWLREASEADSPAGDTALPSPHALPGPLGGRCPSPRAPRAGSHSPRSTQGLEAPQPHVTDLRGQRATVLGDGRRGRWPSLFGGSSCSWTARGGPSCRSRPLSDTAPQAGEQPAGQRVAREPPRRCHDPRSSSSSAAPGLILTDWTK